MNIELRENRLMLTQVKREQERGDGNPDIRDHQHGLDSRNDPSGHDPRRTHSKRLQSHFVQTFYLHRFFINCED